MSKHKWTEEELEETLNYIRENRHKYDFDTADPSAYHGTHFWNKLHFRIRQAYISIVPHLTKLAVTTILVFAISFFAWGNWLSPNKDKKTLGSVSIEYRMKEIKYNYFVFIATTRLRLNKEYHLFKTDIKELDAQYDELQIDLNQNPKDPRIIKSMEQYYLYKLQTLNDALKSHELKTVALW